MNMQNKEIFDETFDIDRSESYILSIQLSPKGYSFAVKDTVKDSFIVLNTSYFEKELRVDDDWTESINEMFSKHELLNKKFKKVFLTFESQLFTLIPSDYFVAVKAKQLFTLVMDLPEFYELHFKEVNNIVLLFAVPSSLLTQFKIKQPNTILVGYPLPTLNSALMSTAMSSDAHVVANVSNGFIVNVVAQGKMIKNCTPYIYQNIDDIAYHLVNCCKQLDFVPGNLNLNIAGVYHEQNDLVQLLTKFFKKISFEKGFMGDHYSYSIDNYKTQHWNLFNLSQCE